MPFHNGGEVEQRLPALDFNMFPGAMHGSSGESFVWFEAQLKRFTYKPGFKMRVQPNLGFMGPCILLTMKVEDTYHPGVFVEVMKPCPLEGVPAGNEQIFAQWLAGQLQELEIHESREWLKRDGVIYDNPHR